MIAKGNEHLIRKVKVVSNKKSKKGDKSPKKEQEIECFHSTINNKNIIPAKQPIKTILDDHKCASEIHKEVEIENRRGQHETDGNIFNKWTSKWIKRNENTASINDNTTSDFINRFKNIFKKQREKK